MDGEADNRNRQRDGWIGLGGTVKQQAGKLASQRVRWPVRPWSLLLKNEPFA